MTPPKEFTPSKTCKNHDWCVHVGGCYLRHLFVHEMSQALELLDQVIPSILRRERCDDPELLKIIEDIKQSQKIIP